MREPLFLPTVLKISVPVVENYLVDKIKSGAWEANLPGAAAVFRNGGGTLSTMKPLNSKSLTQVKEGMLTAYKPAYDTETALNALETTGMFE